MVYESDFYTTRRSYTRPTVSSYTVSEKVKTSVRTKAAKYPIYSYTPVVRRVYTASYPIYSYKSIPYVAHKRLVVGTRIINSPVRSTYSPIRYIRTTRTYSPVRVIESPVRELSPIRTTSLTYSSPITTYSYSLPISSYSYSSPLTSYTPSYRTLPSTLYKEYQRIENRVRPRFGYRYLDDYLNSNSYIQFDDEARRIRTSAATLLREIHTPVFRRARSVTPFPVTRPEPVSSSVLNAYISRVTNPLRPYIDDPSINLDPITRRYIGGKSHLASVRYVGGKAYNIRNPLYDPDRVRTDVEFLSRYLRDRRAMSEKLPARELLLDSVAEANEVAASG